MKTCLVCSGELRPASRYPGLLQCTHCKFITADTELGHDDLKALYGHDYFHGEEYGDYIEEREALSANFESRLKDLISIPSVSRSSKLYEVGCAYGFFLDLARQHFSTVAGIDISDDAISYARQTLGLDVTSGDFLDSEMAFRPDLICMWDVIEHLMHPDRVIARASEVLAPGGHICITTGDIGSLVARIRGPHWRMVHPPTHLHYFTRSTMEKLLVNNGFTLVSVTYPSVRRTFGAMLYGILKLQLGFESVYGVLSKLPGQDISIPINLFDIMLVIARKNGRPDEPTEVSG